MYMRWKSAYETGIPIIDVQHREMFEISLFPDLDGRPEMFQLLKLLVEHQKTEETLMQLYAYEELEAHHREHERIVGALKHAIRKKLTFPVQEILLQHFEEDRKSLAPLPSSNGSESQKDGWLITSARKSSRGHLRTTGPCPCPLP